MLDDERKLSWKMKAKRNVIMMPVDMLDKGKRSTLEDEGQKKCYNDASGYVGQRKKKYIGRWRPKEML